MKFLLVIFAIAILSTSASAQKIEWSKALGGTGDDGAYCIHQTKDGGYIMAGFTTSTDGDVTGRISDGDNDVWIVKLSSSGAIEWKKFLGGSGDDIAYWVDETTDGFIVAANSSSSDRDVTDFIGAYDYWILKLNTQGEVQWKKSFGGAEEDDPQMVHQVSDGGYVVVGYSSSSDGDVTGNHGFFDFWVLKLTTSGTIEWAKSYGGTQDDKAVGFRETPDKGYVIAGFSYSSNGDVTGHHTSTTATSDAWAIKIDKNGTLQWQRSVGGRLDDQFDDVELTDDGGFLFVGYTFSNDGDLVVEGHHGGANLSDGLITKLNSNGVIEWVKIIGGRYNDECYTINKCTDGSFLIAAYTESDDIDNITQHGVADYWVVRIDKDGNVTQQMTYGGSDYDQLYCVDQTTDNGIIVGGFSISSDQDVIGNHTDTTLDAWIVKIAPPSASVIVSKNDMSSSVYPNPMKDHSMIMLPPSFVSGHSISFSLVSVMGSEVRREVLGNNDNYLMLERGGLSAGLYHYRFVREDGISVAGNLVLQ